VAEPLVRRLPAHPESVADLLPRAAERTSDPYRLGPDLDRRLGVNVRHMDMGDRHLLLVRLVLHCHPF
jgi:hypothetical protein